MPLSSDIFRSFSILIAPCNKAESSTINKKAGGNISAELEINNIFHWGGWRTKPTVVYRKVNLKFIRQEKFNFAFRQKAFHAEIIHVMSLFRYFNEWRCAESDSWDAFMCTCDNVNAVTKPFDIRGVEFGAHKCFTNCRSTLNNTSLFVMLKFKCEWIWSRRKCSWQLGLNVCKLTFCAIFSRLINYASIINVVKTYVEKHQT